MLKTIKKGKKTPPQCIGVIMDGNRRWARSRGLPAFLGHSAGYKKFKDFTGWAQREGVKHLIVYAFSTENWSRSEGEIKHMLKLLRTVLETEIESLKKESIRVRFIGGIEKFPKDIIEKIHMMEKETAQGKGIEVLIALSYGGRAEIVSAIKKLSLKDIEHITEKNFSERLSTQGTPDPDLIIRTGGEMRLSNFLLWQSAYSELFFTKTYWPDFSKKEFENILADFSSRERRNGK